MCKRAKTIDGVAVDNLHHAQTSLGVRTRAKTMALKKLLSSKKIMEDITTGKGDDGCYLQLRSRRVERRIGPIGKKTKENKGKNVDLQKGKVGIYGDNELESENNERRIRESTPSDLIVSSDVVKSPRLRYKTATNYVNAKKKIGHYSPTMMCAETVEELFARSEDNYVKNIEEFIKKYNFDPVNDKPLKGRYEWEELEDVH